LILFAALALSTAACSESIADEAGRLPPLDQLSNAHLGMRAYALRRARPNAAAAPCFGFTERIGPIELQYEVPGSVQDGQAPPRWERLQSVVATERLASHANVFALWQTAVRRAAITIESSPTCYTLSSLRRTGWLALWQRHTADVFVIGQIIVDNSISDSTSRSLATGVAQTGRALNRTAFAPRTARPCSELLGG